MDYEFWPFSCSFEFNLVSLRYFFSLCLAFQEELHEHYVSNFLLRFFSADIVFIVKDKPHPIFKRDDDNLIYTATVPLGKVNKHFELKQ